MKKILCFDSWTRGSHHFNRLRNDFNKNGFIIILIHFGSWGHDINRPKEEDISGLIVRDISFYGDLGLKQVLKMENPDVVLFLSVRSFLHQSLIRYCRFLNIKTVHLYHGITQDEINDTSIKKNKTISLSIIRSKIVKNFFRTIPVYIKSIYETNSNISDYLIILFEIINKINSNYFRKAPSDCITDLGFVYLPYEIKHMNYYYGVPIDKIYSFGNPDLVDFNFQQDLLGIGFLENRSNNKEIIYFDAGYLRAGLYYTDNFDFLNNLLKIEKYLSVNGFKLLVKLHPSSSDAIINLLLENNIKLVSRDELTSALTYCKGVISEPSTLSLLPAIMGLPLYLVNFDKLKSVSYSNVITSYSRSKILTNIEEVSKINCDFNKEKELFDNWISTYIVNTNPNVITEAVVSKIINEL